jgi:hypothetical protein
MALAEIREQIKTIISGVSGIGIVHDYERWAVEESKILSLYKDTDGRINGCAFTKEKRLKGYSPGGIPELAYVFKFIRIMGLRDADATGIIFDDHLELMGDAFDGKETLNDNCLTINPDWGPMQNYRGLQIEVIEPRRFSNVLCHYAECRLGVLTYDLKEE